MVDRRMWFSRRAVGLHALIIVIVPTFLALCVWQLRRALGGNELSWAYVFEWPFFAGYAVYMWWRFVHETPADAPLAATAPGAPAAGAAATTDRADVGAGDACDACDACDAAAAAAGDASDAAELAAYNAYLAELAARDRRAPRP